MSSKTFLGPACLRAIAACVKGDVPVCVVGAPGTAKTATLTSLLSADGNQSEVIIGSTRSPEDFSGLPSRSEDGFTDLSLDRWVARVLETDEENLFTLILDELNTAPPDVMAAMLRVINERVVGYTHLPKNFRVVAITNPDDIAVNGTPFPAPMANRLAHIPWAFDQEAWLAGMLTNFSEKHRPYSLDELTVEPTSERASSIAALITTYVRRNPGSVTDGVPEDPTQAAGAWASPRTWHMLSRTLPYLDPKDESAIRLLVYGLVGEGHGTAFMNFWKTASLIDPVAAMADPDRVDWGAPQDVLFSLMMSVASVVLQSEGKDDWERAMELYAKCASKGKPDIAMPAVVVLMRSVPQDARLSDYASEALGKHVIRPKIAVGYEKKKKEVGVS